MSNWVSDNSWNTPIYFSQWGGSAFVRKDNGARLVEINGDGLVDILLADEESDRKVWINTGDGWEYDSSWKVPLDFTGNYENFGDLGVRAVDINGDGLVDLVYGDEHEELKDPPTSRVPRSSWINSVTGWENQTDIWRLPVYLVIEETLTDHGDGQVRFIDFNRDGLVDIYETISSGANGNVWMNTGEGWVEDNSWNPGGVPNIQFFGGQGSGSSDGDNGWRMADYNGDGMVDFLIYRQDTSNQKTFINTGGKSWSDISGWHSPEEIVQRYGGLPRGVYIVDINGDGFPDIAGDNSVTRINNNQMAYFLSNITSSFGGVTSIDYIPSTRFDNTGEDNLSDLGFNVWVVANITEDSGEVISTIQYDYSGGLYDYEDNDFRGFAEVNETIGTKTVAHYFYQDDAKKGLEYKTELYDGSEIYAKTENIYEESGTDYFTVLLGEQDTYIYDGESSNPQIAKTTYSYDEFGNPVEIDYYGDVDVLSASSSDDMIAWYENDGSESFTQHLISTSADGANHVFSIDVDSDGDVDVLSASENDDKIAWYENDGSQNFIEHIISDSANGAQSVYAIDVDSDGDVDVLSISLWDGKLSWYELGLAEDASSTSSPSTHNFTH